MGKARHKQNETKDILALAYLRDRSLLFGQIALFRHRRGSEATKPFHQSAPFVISDSIGPGENVVYGSVGHLVHEVQCLLKDMHDHMVGLDAALGGAAQAPAVRGHRVAYKQLPEGEKARRTYFEYSRRIANTLILMSCQTRNLFQVFPRLNKRSISLFDRNGKSDGQHQAYGSLRPIRAQSILVS